MDFTGTMKPEEIKAEDIVLLECIKDFDPEFKEYYKEEYKPFMKAGWKTWTEKEWLRYIEDGTLILETNHYRMNFPKEHFVIVE